MPFGNNPSEESILINIIDFFSFTQFSFPDDAGSDGGSSMKADAAFGKILLAGGITQCKFNAR
jgi:hypothetical protein